MNIIIDQKGNSKVAVIDCDDIIISDSQSALDLMATVRYEHECGKIVINKSNIAEEFFDLRSGLAGEILQNYSNYGIKIAIVGDFSIYGSKSLKDFIYECNNGGRILFLPNGKEAVERLHK